MADTKPLGSLDYFKIIAALLVIAIHTSPLTSFNVEADFVLTRIIARTAVPFFLMVTGYFLLPQYIWGKSMDYRPLFRFIQKNAAVICNRNSYFSSCQSICRTVRKYRSY